MHVLQYSIVRWLENITYYYLVHDPVRSGKTKCVVRCFHCINYYLLLCPPLSILSYSRLPVSYFMYNNPLVLLSYQCHNKLLQHIIIIQYLVLYQTASNCIKLHQTASNCIKLQHTAVIASDRFLEKSSHDCRNHYHSSRAPGRLSGLLLLDSQEIQKYQQNFQQSNKSRQPRIEQAQRQHRR